MTATPQGVKEIVRSVGGIVHSDGNIFFTNAAQFEAAALLASQGAATDGDVLPPLPEAVAEVLRGGTPQCGHATVLARWLPGAEELPLGKHKLLTEAQCRAYALEAIRSSQAGGTTA